MRNVFGANIGDHEIRAAALQIRLKACLKAAQNAADKDIAQIWLNHATYFAKKCRECMH